MSSDMLDLTPEYRTCLVLDDVQEECERQIEKWGEQSHLDGTGPTAYPLHEADDLLDLRTGAELAEIFKARCQANTPDTDNWRDIFLEEAFEALAESDLDALRIEIIQTAAVLVSWARDIDLRKVQASS